MNRINLICLGVKDMEESLSFYKKIGFKTYEKENRPPIVFSDNQGSKLELFPIDELAKDSDKENPPSLTTGDFNGITLTCNCKSEEEVDECMRVVEESGGEVVKQPEKVSWGGYSGYFKDSNGYYWEVAYGSIWKFDEEDMLIIE